MDLKTTLDIVGTVLGLVYLWLEYLSLIHI